MKTPKLTHTRLAFYTAYNVILFLWFLTPGTPNWMWGVLAFNLITNVFMIWTQPTEKKKP